ncbi:MAG: hypothetical protein ACREDR_26705 [Blastocatellia bacterium]
MTGQNKRFGNSGPFQELAGFPGDFLEPEFGAISPGDIVITIIGSLIIGFGYFRSSRIRSRLRFGNSIGIFNIGNRIAEHIEFPIRNLVDLNSEIIAVNSPIGTNSDDC